MRLGRFLLATTLLGSACSDVTGPDDPGSQLALARTRWASAGISSYRYTISRSCECLPESAGPVVVEVREGQIIDRRYETGAAVSPQYADVFTSVPGLFDLITVALTAPAASLSVRYHPEIGYPESIAIDWVAGAVDDEISYRITGFMALR
jgi:hypothetical protein